MARFLNDRRLFSLPGVVIMVTKIGTSRRKTRSKLSKKTRAQGKISISSYFKSFKQGDKVTLKSEPAIQKGMYFPRFYGKIGTIAGKQGNCYRVQIKDKKKQKTLIVHSVHLKKA